MELTEISDRIDIKLNTFEVPIEVDEYEKSIYLTRAQKLVYKELCDIFEVNGIISNYLQPFILEYTTPYPIQEVIRQGTIVNSRYILVATNIYRTVLEKVILSSSDLKYNNRSVKVIKTRLGEIPYKLDNPFRQPNNKEVLRVTADNNNDPLYTYEIIIPDNTEILQYSCKYLKDIEPIILENLDSTLSIEGVSIATNTLFSDEVLEKIIDIAVMSILQDKTVFNQSKNV